jgi:hypothetical protein
MNRVAAPQAEQPRSAAGRGGLDHRGGRGDPRVGAAQVVLDLGEVRAHRRGAPVSPEGLAEVLVDVGIDGHDWQSLRGQVPDEQR